jgi:hypothetical protein
MGVDYSDWEQQKVFYRFSRGVDPKSFVGFRVNCTRTRTRNFFRVRVPGIDPKSRLLPGPDPKRKIRTRNSTTI